LAAKIVLIPVMLRAAGNNVIASNIMHLICPQCHTEYEVPDAALAGRVRTLRCADCGATFKAPALPVAAEIEPEAPPPPEIIAPEPEPIPEPEIAFSPEIVEPAMTQVAFTEIPAEVVEAPPAPEPSRAPAALSKPAPKPAQPAPNRALGVSVLIVLLIIAAVLAEHRVIAHAWPPSLRLFNALGLH
jgi:predicted Zn finger-like uncharacterized protein